MRTQTITWNGIEYDSLEACATAIGISELGLKSRLQKGQTCDKDVGTVGNKRKIMWNGVQYPSISKAARVAGISRQAMHQRIQAGYTCDKDLKR